MKRLAWFTLGAVFFTACGGAAINFPYKYFFASPIEVWEFPGAKLLGAEPKDDRLLSECKPVDSKDKDGKPIKVQKCGVIFLDELERLIIDYKKTKSDLISCEHRNSN